MTNSFAFEHAQEEKTRGASCLIPGQLVDNTYRIERCLGTGTMGEVYLCPHVGQRGAVYAMKVLRLSDADLQANPDMIVRFENEAKTTYLVNHPNVVGSFSFIRSEGLVAFTMEYIPGGDLADRISAERCFCLCHPGDDHGDQSCRLLPRHEQDVHTRPLRFGAGGGESFQR